MGQGAKTSFSSIFRLSYENFYPFSMANICQIRLLWNREKMAKIAPFLIDFLRRQNSKLMIVKWFREFPHHVLSKSAEIENHFSLQYCSTADGETRNRPKNTGCSQVTFHTTYRVFQLIILIPNEYWSRSNIYPIGKSRSNWVNMSSRHTKASEAILAYEIFSNVFNTVELG